MLSETLKVRFYETDALQHVSNTVIVGWFETAREPIFKIFNPSLDVTRWPLILASYKVDLVKQIFFGENVEIKTGVSRLGNSSFDIYQEVWQKGELCAKGTTVMVHFDYNSQRSVPISDDIKQALNELMVEEE